VTTVLVVADESGADATTVFEDRSDSNRAVSTVANAQWDTSTFPTGLSAALLLDGTGDCLTMTSSADFGMGTGDFTVDGFYKQNTSTGIQVVVSLRQSGGAGPQLQLTNSTIAYFEGLSGQTKITSEALPIGTWRHLALCRGSNSTRLFVDGTQVGSTYVSSDNLQSNNSCTIGSDRTSTNFFNGWLASVRVTKGEALYTDTFTPPALPLVAMTLTGSAVSSITETDIVAGGKEIIATLSGGGMYVPELSTKPFSFVTSVAISSLTTFTTSFIIQLPSTQAMDLMLLEYVHRSTSTGDLFGSGGTGTSWTLKHSQMFATSTFSGHLWYRRATGNHSSETISVSSLINSCAAHVAVYRGALESGDPLAAATVVGEQNASADEQQAGISTDRVSTFVCLVVLNAPDLAVATQSSIAIGSLTERADVQGTAGTDASIAHASALFTGTGDTSTFTWTQTNAASGSFAYAISPHTTSPFTDARQALIDGFDSAQSEATGWDAEVKAKAAVTEVVRTSDTVVTWTIAAQAGYNITATETITGTIPAAILMRNVSFLATPTFTVSTGGAVAVIRLLYPSAFDGQGVGGVFFGNRVR
jgi:hypothetical protein